MLASVQISRAEAAQRRKRKAMELVVEPAPYTTVRTTTRPRPMIIGEWLLATP